MKRPYVRHRVELRQSIVRKETLFEQSYSVLAIKIGDIEEIYETERVQALLLAAEIAEATAYYDESLEDWEEFVDSHMNERVHELFRYYDDDDWGGDWDPGSDNGYGLN